MGVSLEALHGGSQTGGPQRLQGKMASPRGDRVLMNSKFRVWYLGLGFRV